MQEGRTTRNGAQGVCIILITKYSKGSKVLKNLFKGDSKTGEMNDSSRKKPRVEIEMEQWTTFDKVEQESVKCLRKGLSSIFKLTNPDGELLTFLLVLLFVILILIIILLLILILILLHCCS